MNVSAPISACVAARLPTVGGLLATAFLLLLAPLAGVAAQEHHHEHGHQVLPQVDGEGNLIWRMPMDVPMEPMIGDMASLVPAVTPFLPGMGVDPESLPLAGSPRITDLAHGDTLVLEATLARRELNGREYVIYAFNEQVPGPLVRVEEGATAYIDFRNRIEWPSAIHWHGIRLDNPFDGVPGVTQAPVEVGEDFLYEIHFKDAGIYWYHPHLREDIGQSVGLYGNIRVAPAMEDYWGPANREELLLLDDILIDQGEMVPFGLEHSNFALMGRFGNTYLVNGQPDYRLEVDEGEVVRYHFTNVSSTRTYNLSFSDGAPMKVVGSDVGIFEREEWVETIVIAPAERYTVDVRHPQRGEWALENRVQAVNLFRGDFYGVVDTLGLIVVGDEPARPDLAASFEELRVNEWVIEEIDEYRHHFDRPPDHELDLTLRIGSLPLSVMQMIAVDTAYFPPVEWTDVMPMMNWVSTGRDVEWILRDPVDRRENMEIHWRFDLGEVVKIRIFNDPSSFHPMNHPIHFHGQRFLVLERDGMRNPNLVWKDTTLVPSGSTVDILLELSNPGTWMVHCHILEHFETGMALLFSVDDPDDPGGGDEDDDHQHHHH
jgi:suppressor of ftsI